MNYWDNVPVILFSEPVDVAATMLEPLKIVLIASAWCE
jgi:hypothetical protein